MARDLLPRFFYRIDVSDNFIGEVADRASPEAACVDIMGEARIDNTFQKRKSAGFGNISVPRTSTQHSKSSLHTWNSDRTVNHRHIRDSIQRNSKIN